MTARLAMFHGMKPWTERRDVYNDLMRSFVRHWRDPEVSAKRRRITREAQGQATFHQTFEPLRGPEYWKHIQHDEKPKGEWIQHIQGQNVGIEFHKHFRKKNTNQSKYGIRIAANFWKSFFLLLLLVLVYSQRVI